MLLFSYPVMIHSADGFQLNTMFLIGGDKKNTTLLVASVEGFNNYKCVIKTLLTRRNGSISHNTVLAKQDEIGAEGV